MSRTVRGKTLGIQEPFISHRWDDWAGHCHPNHTKAVWRRRQAQGQHRDADATALTLRPALPSRLDRLDSGSGRETDINDLCCPQLVCQWLFMKVQHSPPGHMQVGVDGGRLQRPDGPHVQPKRWGELCIWLSPPLVRERHGRNPRAVINSNGGITKPNNHALYPCTSGCGMPSRARQQVADKGFSSRRVRGRFLGRLGHGAPRLRSDAAE